MTIQLRDFGASGARVPVLGIGTWQMEDDGRAGCVAAIRAALDLGLTHVDTAELYGNGKVEEIVADAIDGRRDEVFLVSKVVPRNADRRGTVAACERSLERLRTDRLDCYLLHWPGSHPLEDTIAAFEQLVSEGKIRSWGVSNFDVGELERAQRIAGPGRIACNQVLYHLKQRSIEHAVLPWCERNRVALVGYSPFGAGDFPAKDATLSAIANKHRVSTHAVALAFLTRHPSTFAIPKSAHDVRVRANALAATLTLDAIDIDAIERAFPLGRPRGLATL